MGIIPLAGVGRAHGFAFDFVFDFAPQAHFPHAGLGCNPCVSS